MFRCRLFAAGFAVALISFGSGFATAQTRAQSNSTAAADQFAQGLTCKRDQDCWADDDDEFSKTRGVHTPTRRPIVMGTEEGRRDYEDRANRGLLPSIESEVYFDRNSSEIVARSRETLDRIGREILNMPPDQQRRSNFGIAGHTDAVGTVDYNQGLSERRAQAVALYLTANYPIEMARLDVYGRGKSEPKTPSDPFAAVNRRVHVITLGPNAHRVTQPNGVAGTIPRPNQPVEQAPRPQSGSPSSVPNTSAPLPAPVQPQQVERDGQPQPATSRTCNIFDATTNQMIVAPCP